MTDKARELLERALLYVDVLCPIYEEIRAYLAEPTQDEEPVAWASGVRDLLSWDKLYDDMSPLYFHSKQKTQNEKRMDAILALCGKSAPRPEFVRLSGEEMKNVMLENGVGDGWVDVIRAVEDALEEKNK